VEVYYYNLFKFKIYVTHHIRITPSEQIQDHRADLQIYYINNIPWIPRNEKSNYIGATGTNDYDNIRKLSGGIYYYGDDSTTKTVYSQTTTMEFQQTHLQLQANKE
jgi:hypothetical protein